MKIKRFFAEDMRSALLRVREAMGPDAVILSNQRVEGGMEIVAALDYDESLFQARKEQTAANPASFIIDSREETARKAVHEDLRYTRHLQAAEVSEPPATKRRQRSQQSNPAIAEMQNEIKSLRGLLINQLSGLSWGNEVQFHPLRARLLQRLIALGLSPKLARELSMDIIEEDDFEFHWRQALGNIAHQLPVANDPILNQGGVIALVGATGVGKTTTIAKLAARYTLKHGPNRVALVTTDNYRVAAHEQLRSYARIMGVPMRITADMDELREALHEFRDRELVLIDTAGMSQRDIELSKQLALFRGKGLEKIQVYLTLATNCQRAVLEEVTQAFSEVSLAGCIFTKLDETTSLGGAISVAVEHQLAVAYTCDGQQVPEDMHIAREHSLVSKAVGIMQNVAAGQSRDESLTMTVGGMLTHSHG